jgi:beta-lactamase regulating signal transducer with metallopeptidase domain
MNAFQLPSLSVPWVGALADKSPLLGRVTLTSLELAVLVLAVAALIGALRIRSPRVRALLWLVVLAKPLLGLVIGAPLAVVQVEPSAIDFAAARERALMTQQLLTDDMAGLAVRGDRPGATDSTHGARGADALAAGEASAPTAHLTEPPTARARQSAADGRGFSSERVLLWLWLAGIAAFAALALIDRLCIHRMRRVSSDPPVSLARRCAELARAMGMRRAPELRVTGRLESPALVGLLRPCIFMPRWLAESGDAGRFGQIDWLLRHELMHWKMRDPLGLVVRRLAEVLFFFHPAVWWAGRKWEEAMELACDRALLASATDARHYAEELYRVLEGQHARRRAPLAAGLFATRTQIGRRIEALLADPMRLPARLNGGALRSLIVFGVLGLTVGAGFAGRSEQTKAQETGPRTMAQRTPQASGASIGLIKPEPTPSDPALVRLYTQIAQTQEAITTVKDGVACYYLRHRALPANLADLAGTEGPLRATPEDPFAPGNPIEYFLNDERTTATIYSVGPNARNDGGLNRPAMQANRVGLGVKLETDGDIWESISLATLARQYPENLTPEQLDDVKTNGIISRLLAIKEREGRDNAMIHYVVATLLMGDTPSVGQMDLMDRVRREGWNAEADSLLPLLERSRPMLDAFRRGAAVGYARNAGAGMQSAVPNFLSFQILAKVLCARGEYMESQGRPADALED